MKLSDVKTFRDLCSSMFVLNFEPEHNKKKKATRAKKPIRRKKNK
jgi:hypothetical protein